MDYVYRFPVVKGLQAYREYYIAMVPLKMIGKLFPSEDEYVLPEYRAQRKLNAARIPEIAKYITDNRGDYVFSALSASIDGDFRFIPAGESSDIGILEVDMDARFLINDGQHRKAAILKAIEEDDTLLAETISVVFFEDKGLARSQQIFTDLNKHAVKTSNSIAELYDSRDDLAVITRNVVSSIPFFNEFTDKEKDILGKYSSNFFTLNTLYKANQRVVKHCDDLEKCEKFLFEFWSTVDVNMTLWKEVEKKIISKVDIREQYIVTQAVVIQALGGIGRYFYDNPKVEMASVLAGLQAINWKRNAAVWQGRTISNNGRVISSDTASILTANAIKSILHIPLTDVELRCENKFKAGRK